MSHRRRRSKTLSVRPLAHAGRVSLLTILLILATALAVIYVSSILWMPSQQESASGVVSDAEHKPLKRAEKPTAPQTHARRTERNERNAAPRLERPLSAETSEDTGEAFNLLARWRTMRSGNEPLKPDQIEEIKSGLKKLVTIGPSAVSAIAEFLGSGDDLPLHPGYGPSIIDYTSLRRALIDVLQRIGGPKALRVMADTLPGTSDPVEVAMLGAGLERQAPGAYHGEVLSAARRVLTREERRDGATSDGGVLVAILGVYGDAQAVDDLAAAYPHWKRQSALALGMVADGSGIPVLARFAGEEAVASSKDQPALWMLAQTAGTRPAAGPALLEVVRANQPDKTGWETIVGALAGAAYTFPPGILNGEASLGEPSTSDPRLIGDITDTWSLAEIEQRLALVEELLRIAESPGAVKALEGAQRRLQKLKGP